MIVRTDDTKHKENGNRYQSALQESEAVTEKVSSETSEYITDDPVQESI